MKGGWGSKAVWNFSKNSSDIAQPPFPKELVDAAKTEIGSLTKIEPLQVISVHSADFYPLLLLSNKRQKAPATNCFRLDSEC